MSNKKSDILVIGSGSLARTFCYAIALTSQRSLRVCILGRFKSSVDEVVTVSNARAAAFSSKVTFVGDTIDWASENDLADKLGAYSPRLILQSASLQSPWELRTSQSNWGALIKEGGFGITVPLQSALVARVASLIKSLTPSSILVNACYPDAVNPLLHYLGLPVTCGVGNVGILAAVLNAQFALRRQLQVVAHHFHIISKPGGEPPLVWLDGESLLDLEAKRHIQPALSRIRAIKGAELNQIVGAVSAEVVLALLGHSPIISHVPGPNGLPGGYPVLIQNGQVELALPPDCSTASAIDLNSRAAYEEGAAVIDKNGFIGFNAKASEAIRQYAPSLANGFYAKDLQAVCQEFIELRGGLS